MRRIREILDRVAGRLREAEDLTGPDGLLKRLTGALVERSLGTELTDRLGYEPGGRDPDTTGNESSKTLITVLGEIPIEVPRDRQGTFAQLVKKYQRRFEDFDQKNRVDVRARDDGARDPGASGRTLGHRGLAESDLDRNESAGGRGDQVESTSSASCRTATSTWRSASTSRAGRKCWGCGSRPAKAPSSGSRWLPNSRSRPAGHLSLVLRGAHGFAAGGGSRVPACTRPVLHRASDP